MLNATQDNSESVAMEATEFWTALLESAVRSDNHEVIDLVEKLLDRLIPTLLMGLLYADDDAALEAEQEDGSKADNESDLKPRHHKIKSTIDDNNG